MNPENTEVPLLATPEAENAAADAAAAGILGDDSLLGPALEGEALEEEIRRQVEYFLSREYLSTDPYLVSQMNSDMYFPITTVATLTTFKVDLEVLVKTLRKSTLLSVNDNGTMVKPSFKIQRNTLILRDIPSSTKVEEVQGIFQGEGCPTTTGIRPDIGDCWFVTFNSEEDALSALDFVRGRTFHDAPVKARIKSENLLRSFTYYPPAAAPAAGDLGMKMGGQYAGYNYYPQYGAQHTQGGDHQEQRRTRGGGGGGHRQPGGGAAGPRKDYRGGNSNKYSNDGVLGTGHNPTAHTSGSPAPGAPATSPPVPNTNTRGSSQAPVDSDNRKQRRQPSTRTSNNRKQEGTTPNTTTTPTTNPKPSQSQQPLQFGLAHFPPLSSQSQQPKHTGYTKDFTKFTKQQLIDIVTSTPVPNQQPSSFPTECLATLTEPNTQVVISPESNLDRLRPQESGADASPKQEGEATSTSTAPTPTPAQPTMTMASLVATHKSIPAPAPAPAPKKPQPKAKPAPQPKKEQAHAKGQQSAKKASPPTNARKGAAQKKKPEEGAAQQQSATSSTTPTPASPAPAASTSAAAAAAPASPATSSPAPAPAAAASSAAPTSPSAAAPSSGSSTPTYAQLAAKAASKQPVQPKKEAEKKEEPKKEEPKEAKKEEPKKDEPKKEDKESASA